MNPTILGVVGPGFLNQVPTLEAQENPAVEQDKLLGASGDFVGVSDNRGYLIWGSL